MSDLWYKPIVTMTCAEGIVCGTIGHGHTTEQPNRLANAQ